MYGQQSLTPPVGAVTAGFGGGQLIEAALTVLVRAAAWGQAAAGPAVSAIATAASTTVLASLAGGREAGRAPLSRCGCLGFISGFLCCRLCGPVHAVHPGGQVSTQGRRRMRSPRRPRAGS